MNNETRARSPSASQHRDRAVQRQPDRHPVVEVTVPVELRGDHLWAVTTAAR